MTTANLAEQLLAIGRQLQVTERRLTYLPAILEFPPALQQLLTDPLARLTDLLRPLANWPVLQPTPDKLTSVLAPFRSSSPASQPPIKPPGEDSLPAAEAFTDRGAPRWSANHGEASRPLPNTPAAVDTPTRWWSAASEALPTTPSLQGTRLVHERAALLSILQSNVAPTPEPPASTDAARALAPEAGRRAAAGAAAIPQRYTMAQPVTVPAYVLEAGTTATPQLEATGEARSFAPPPAAQRPTVGPGRQPDTGNGSAIHRPPELPVGADATVENFPALPPLARDRPHPWTSSLLNGDTPLHPSQGDATSGQGMVEASQALNTVQLEQIMEALVERLELTLLRAYGTTGA